MSEQERLRLLKRAVKIALGHAEKLVEALTEIDTLTYKCQDSGVLRALGSEFFRQLLLSSKRIIEVEEKRGE